MRSLIRGTGATAANALSLLAPQLVALFVLQAEEFGLFSLVYLVYALGCSVLLSVVCESSTRRSRRTGEEVAPKRSYLGATAWVAVTLGIVAALLGSAVLDNVGMALACGVAVAAAVYRVGARFLEVQTGAWFRATAADLTSIVVLVITYCGLVLVGEEALFSLIVAWAIAGLLATVVGMRARPAGPWVLVRWCRDHREDIPALLRESLVMDFSSIGAPFVIAPVLGAAQFGIYRAVSNVAAPVRLVLNPVRPRIAVMSQASALSRRVVLVVVGSAALLGGGASVVLWAIGETELRLGVLLSLAPYAVPSGLFVFLNFIGHYFYLVARTHADAGALWRGRLVQSGSAFLLPVVGALVGGLSWAMWMYVLSTALGAASWVLTDTRRLRKSPSSGESRADHEVSESAPI